VSTAVVAAWALVAAVCAVAATWVATQIALRDGMVDVPNARSSHGRPTPRGGGLGIVVVVTVAAAFVAVRGGDVRATALALLVGGLPIAAVGWLDDRRDVPTLVRLGVHVGGASTAVVLLGGLPELALGEAQLALGAPGAVLAVLIAVWCTNAYNFMDGIDGIAGAEGVVVGLGLAVLLWPAAGLASLAAVVGGACAGFLVWNWQPARVFMGDVSSGFLGFTFSVLALAGARAGALDLPVSLLLLGVFLVDATATLLRRIAAGERFMEAHRSHAYQRAVQRGWSHAQVTSTVVALDVVLLIVALWGREDGPSLAFGALLAMAGLLSIWWLLAGPRRTPTHAPRARG
jgi:Fuc2NAc and GlcNAc transferase